MDAGKMLALVSWLGYLFYGIPALVVRILEADGNRFARWHAAEALNLQLTMMLIWAAAVPAVVASMVMLGPDDDGVMVVFMIVWSLAVLMSLGVLVVVVFGAVRASQGQWWRCPVAIPFLRRHRREGHD